MQEIKDDYYRILGIEEKATPDDIRKGYLKLAKKLHPDRFPNDPVKKAEAQTEFARVTRAHEVLGDPRQREEYDAIRTLARNRAALDTGTPGSTVVGNVISGTEPAGTAGQDSTGDQKSDTKESWALKHSNRAQECIKRKRYQEAETAVKEAIRLDPNRVQYHCQLAEVYIARGWKTLAQAEIQTALRLDPQDAQAKQAELKLKASSQKSSAEQDKKSGGGFLDSLNKLLGKKS